MSASAGNGRVHVYCCEREFLSPTRHKTNDFISHINLFCALFKSAKGQMSAADHEMDFPELRKVREIENKGRELISSLARAKEKTISIRVVYDQYNHVIQHKASDSKQALYPLVEQVCTEQKWDMKNRECWCRGVLLEPRKQQTLRELMSSGGPTGGTDLMVMVRANPRVHMDKMRPTFSHDVKIVPTHERKVMSQNVKTRCECVMFITLTP